MTEVKKIRVIKLGGSLLTLPSLNEKFQHWCDENPHPLSLVIVGGGGVVNAIREIDRVGQLPEAFCHWTCIDLLQHTARVAHQILDNVELWETLDQLRERLAQPLVSSPSPVTSIVQLGLCIRRGEPNMGLPESWEVTSDALAAAFARINAAEELVLMKSCDAPGDDSQLERLAAAGFVDPYFGGLAKTIERVSFVNLRSFHEAHRA